MWNFGVSEKQIELQSPIIEQCDDAIDMWLKYFPFESTWIQNNYGVPSILIRLDCVVNANGKLELYEVEERPCGAGLVSKFNPFFKDRLDSVRKSWPDFEAVVSPERKYSDDLEWLPSYGGNGSLVLVRAEPYEKEFHHFQSRSVSTIVTEGDKRYGVGMGLWSLVTPESFQNDEIWKMPFCIKPLKGSKCMNLEIWHPESRFKSGFGVSSRGRILKAIEREQRMYLQKFIEPMKVDGFEGNMIYRIYFGFDLLKKKYEYIGGCYNVRSSFKIHGASDSVFGPVV
jgi:hypothetical protein